MNSKCFCIANWKMYLNNIESINFIKKFSKFELNNDKCKVVICPTYTSIPLLLDLVKNMNISLGSQNISQFQTGPYTGEISTDIIEELGCRWSIIGHSERRQFFNESDLLISEKLKSVYDTSLLTPILCIGETLNEMKDNHTKKVLGNQLDSALSNLVFKNDKDLLIAYEPVWAIGTGISADINVISKNMKIIKDFIKKFDTKNCNIYLLYGGSVTEDNASEISSLNEIDGFLIGSSSIDPVKFYSIYKQF